MPASGTEEEDDLDELPPLDGDVRDAPEPDLDPGELLGDDGDASLDDTTGEGDPVDAEELDVDERDQGWLEEPADAPDLDLGDVAVIDFGGEAPAAEDADEPGVGDEDFGFGNAPERGGLDGGDEGPVGADEELREADLPQLDADEEGDLDDAALVDAGFAADEPVGLPWAAEPWSRVGAPVALYLADVGWTLQRRARRGERLLEAHRTHVYQRWCDAGWSHAEVTLLASALTVLLCLLGVAGTLGGAAVRVTADLAGLAVLAAYLGSPGLFARAGVGGGPETITEMEKA